MSTAVFWEIQSLLAEVRDPLIVKLQTSWRILASQRRDDAIHDHIQGLMSIITAANTTASLTSAAISCVLRLVSGGFIDTAEDSVMTMRMIVMGLVQCKFEGGDVKQEELVLLRVLQSLEACARSKVSAALNEDEIMQIILACLRIFQHPHIAQSLQVAAEDVLLQSVHHFFFGLRSFAANPDLTPRPPVFIPVTVSLTPSTDYDNVDVTLTVNSPPPRRADQAMASVLRHLSDSCSGAPTRLRLLCVRALNAAMEAAGYQALGLPLLREVVANQVSRVLIETARSTDGALVVSALRGVEYIMRSPLRTNMRYQIEAFFISIYLAAADNATASNAGTVVALECLSRICSMPQLIADVFTSFDCDRRHVDVFENLCKYLAKHAVPQAVTTERTTESFGHALECLIAIVESLASACNAPPPTDSDISTTASLRASRQYKAKFAKGIEMFNDPSIKPAKGITALQAMGLVGPSPVDIAEFLRNFARLSPVRVGEYIGDINNRPILDAYVGTFDFTGLSFPGAMRRFLCVVKMPGEAQIVDRYMEALAHRVMAQNPGPVASAGAAYVLMFSLMMLHTDLHNVTIKKKMTIEAWIKNNRQINDGQDFPESFLIQLYNDIQEKNIPSIIEGHNSTASLARWENIINNSQQFSMTSAVPIAAVARDMFAVVWGPIAASFTMVFEATDREDVQQLALQGFFSCARIAARYNMDDVLDNLVSSLCKLTGLLGHDDAVSVLVRNSKARAAALAMFEITRSHGGHLREAWRKVVDCVLSLYANNLLPAEVTPSDSLTDRDLGDVIALITAGPPSPSQQQGFSFFGAMQQYLSLAPEPAPAPDQSAVEMAKQWVRDWRIDELIADTGFLTQDSLQFLIRALILAAIKQPEKKESEAVTINLERSPEVLVCLDLLLAVALHNRDRLHVMWKLLSDFLGRALASGGKVSARALVAVVRLCIRMHSGEALLPEAIALLLKIPPSTATQLAPALAKGLRLITQTVSRTLTSPTAWRDLLTLLEFVASNTVGPAHSAGLDTLALCVVDAPLTEELIPSLANPFLAFSHSPNESIPRVLELLHASIQRATGLCDWTTVVGLPKAVLPLVAVVVTACRDERLDTASHAVDVLSRTLVLAPLRTMNSSGWEALITTVLFPLVADLCTQKADAELIQRIFSLCTKTFLHSIHFLDSATTIGRIWRQMLQCATKCITLKSDLLSEAITEAVKNMLLVLATSHALPQESWDETWAAVDGLSPALRADLASALAPIVASPAPPTR